jgi:phosphoglycerate dehydrogenase-like enzyme
MTTWGLVRTKPTENIPFVDHCRTTSNLEELLRECDYICNVLPSTPETIGLLSGDVLKCCKEKCPVLINLGRADIMDEEALAKAISRRWVSKAVLDVFAVEPLPKDSQLWTMPEVFITPHVSGPTLVHEACVKFLKYLKLYLEGKPLPYAVDFHHGY